MAVRKLNVVHVCDHLGWTGSRMHGVKRLFAWTIPRFDSRRFTVSLVSLRKRDESEDNLERFGIDVTYLDRGRFDPATLPALLRVLKEKQTDILHMHGYGATTFGRLAAAWYRIPTVLHEHANLTSTPWFQQVADELLLPFTDLAIAVSRSTAEFVVSARRVPSALTRIVYLGAPLDDFGRVRSADEVRAARLALGVSDETFAVGTVTRLMPSKGNEYLIAGVSQVLAHCPDVRFYIVGEGELQGVLEEQARALGISDKVRFVGFRRDVSMAYAAFDLVVFPSLWEGTPLTAFEALAMGKPIIATDCDGLLDILTAGTDARIVPRRDAKALAEAVVALSLDDTAREGLGRNARNTGAAYDIG
ncbi:MAG: glycosyltransferase, partial [Acidobacteriota bacterium]|nr:glycosyltransferase [Acidobacteriota bacterium]